jgi:hypothetical protein
MAGQIVLAVHMNANDRDKLYDKGFRSSDQMAGPVESTLRRANLPYSSTFVCIAVYSASEDPHDVGSRAFQCLGPPVILRPSIASEIAIACSMDFQNAVSKSNRHDPKKVFRDLRHLRHKPVDEIEQQILALLSKRPSYTWSEARIHRLLVPDDILEDRYRSMIPL